MVARKEFMIKVKTEEYPTTTRRYPRTLKDAFPDDAEYGEWLSKSEARWDGWDFILAVVFAMLWVGIFYLVVYWRALND